MKLALYPLVQQFQYRNGTNLVAGKIYVYYRGRTRLATIYKDQNGTIAQNPLTCDADGRAPCFVDSNYQYTIVVCDARGKELFSQDLDADNAININDALSGDSKLYIINSDGTISVNATSGDSWIQYDLGTFNKPLGVTEPLYWEKDDEEGSIIGLHADGLVSGVSADLTELSGKVNELSATKMDKSQSAEFYPSNNPSGFIGAEGLSEYQPVSGMTAYQEKGDYYSASNPSGFITNDAITGLQPSGDYATNTQLCAVSSTITGMIPSGEFELCAGNGIELVDDPNAKTTTISVTAQGSNTISYSAKPTDNPIYADKNDLKNVDSIQGKSNLAIVPSGVLQVPNVITAANGNLIVQNAITVTPSYLVVPNVITASTSNLAKLEVPNVITAAPNHILNVSGVITANNNGLFASGISAVNNLADGGFSANGISAGKRGPLCIEGKSEIMYASGMSGFTFSSQNTAFGNAKLGIAGLNSIVKMSAPMFEARNISGAGFSIEASGAKGYDESGNVVWDTNNPQLKNIISYGDTKTAQGGLNGNIILTTQPSTNASNLTSSPYVIMDAGQASYFAAYGPSAQTPTVRMAPDAITFDYAAGNAKTTVGYNNIKQELSGSSWTLTGSIQKRELEYDANTSAITAIAGSAIGGDCGGSALQISAGQGVNLSVSDDKLVMRAVPSDFYTVRISDIILTASLPVSPEANTLYLIQE